MGVPPGGGRGALGGEAAGEERVRGGQRGCRRVPP